MLHVNVNEVFLALNPFLNNAANTITCRVCIQTNTHDIISFLQFVLESKYDKGRISAAFARVNTPNKKNKAQQSIKYKKGRIYLMTRITGRREN